MHAASCVKRVDVNHEAMEEGGSGCKDRIIWTCYKLLCCGCHRTSSGLLWSPRLNGSELFDGRPIKQVMSEQMVLMLELIGVMLLQGIKYCITICQLCL